MNQVDSVDVKIPANYTGNPVRIIVDKERVKSESHVNFVSFRIENYGDSLQIGDKKITLDCFYEMLRIKGGMSDRVPLIVSLSPFRIRHFDIKPPCYTAQRVFPFKWLEVECSLTDDICLRFHAVDYDTALSTLKDICSEAQKLWRDDKSSDELSIQVPWPNGSYFQWKLHINRRKRSLDTIYIKESEKLKLIQSVDNFLASSVLYDHYGITWKQIHLLVGPPGTGKSSTVLAVASHFNMGIAKMTITKTMISTTLEQLFANVPANHILLMEDLDALFVSREATTGIDFSTLLNLMDGVTTKRGLIIFVTTNHLEKLDHALIRPGRVDNIMHFDAPDEEGWRLALRTLGDKWPHEHDAYIKILSERGHHTSIAELQRHLFECHMQDKDTILS